jgi:uncharacterized protein (TIGR00255 family)
MSIRSMTGFGRAAATLGETTYGVEARSVNHRFLEIRLRLPGALGHLEGAVRSLLGTRFRRGRVDLSAVSAFDVEGGKATAVEVDVGLARSLLSAHEVLARSLGVPLRVDTAELTSYPGVLVPVQAAPLTPHDAAALLAAVEQAADALLAMRVAEGEALAHEVSRRLDAVETLRGRIAARVPEQNRAYRVRLEGRMRELLQGLDLQTDQGRILHEVGIFAEKVDVAEELTRLASHLGQARSWLAVDAPTGEDGVGRRLDFLCQEMHREANTIGSKVQDIGVSELVIELKAELERLREQVQNVE